MPNGAKQETPFQKGCQNTSTGGIEHEKFLVCVSVALVVALSAGSVLAESIEHKFGVTGRLGFLNPSDSDFNNFKLETDVGFVGGGGIIYGFNKNIAFEFDITHSWFGSNLPSGGGTGDFSITNFSFGAQYRFADPYPKLTPYVGAGLDVLLNDYEGSSSIASDNADVDTAIGVHISGGVDYFIMKNVAINAELKGVLAPEVDIKRSSGGFTGGNFDPSYLSGTLGVRYFF